ncbi:hypothetical protein [Acrocarpospora phusangensis]|uniref:hypothetical protein n=1 Tax=Acrocarpospora phusangensis TaxID=1070424 RepID=UPI00194FA26E|nr:hypothetical protein [Acrocarpospora phusangensis]
MGAAFDRGGQRAGGFAKATDRAALDAASSIKRMRREIDEALSGIGDINIGVSGGVNVRGLFDGVEEEAREAGERAGDAFVEGADGPLRDSGGRFRSSGSKAGKDVADGFLDGIEPVEAKTLAVATAIGAGLSLLGPVGQLAGAAMALGVGGGLAAIGVSSAASSDQVKSEWSDLGSWFKSELGALDDPIEESLMRIPDIARDAGAQLRGEFHDSFAAIGPQLTDFAADWGKTIGGANLSAETNGFVQVLDAIGYRADEIGGEFGEAFDEMSRVAAEHADDIASSIEIIATGLSETTKFIGFLADDWNRSMGEMEQAFNWWLTAGNMDREWVADLDNSGEAAARAAASAVEMAAGFFEASEGADALAGGIANVSAAMAEYFTPASDVLAAQVALDKAIVKAGNALLDQEGSIAGNEKALSELVRAMEKRIEADSVMNDNIKTSTDLLMDQIPAMLKLAKGSEEGTDAVNGLVAAIGGTIEQVGKAIVVTDSFGNKVKILPNGKVVKIEADDKGTPVFNKFMNLIGKANPKPVAIRADASQAEGVLASLLRKIGSSSANVSVGVLANQRAHGGAIGAYASGGNTRAGALAQSGSAMALVGEAGPELVRLPYGSTVIPAGQTQLMLEEGAGIIRGYASGGPLGTPVLAPPPMPQQTQPYGGSLLGQFDPRSGSGGGRVELDVVNPRYVTQDSGYMTSGGYSGGSSGGGGGGGVGTGPTPGPQEDTISTYVPIGRPGGSKPPPVIDTNPVPAARRGDDFGAGFFAGSPGFSVSGGGGGGGGSSSGGGRGPDGVGLTINVYVQGSIRSDREIEDIINSALLRGAFRGALQS